MKTNYYEKATIIVDEINEARSGIFLYILPLYGGNDNALYMQDKHGNIGICIADHVNNQTLWEIVCAIGNLHCDVQKYGILGIDK